MVDTSMYRNIEAPKIIGPGEVLSLQNVAQQNQLGRVQLENAQREQQDKVSLRDALQGGADPSTGRLTPEALAKVSQINPQLGLGLIKQQEELRLQDIARNEKKEKLAVHVGTAYVSAYDRYLQQTGGNKEQAKQLAQKETNELIDEMEASGSLSAQGFDQQTVARLRQLRDPESTRTTVIGLGGRIPEVAPKQNQTRNRLAGNETIQEEWNPETKTWKEIGRGPRFASLSGVGELSGDALTLAVDQYLAGDSTAAQGYARNAQMKAAFMNRLAERAKEKNMGGADLAARVAEFQGTKAVERTLGTRTANIELAVTEAQNIIPIALAASEKVDRTRYPTINSILQAAQKGTGDENVVRLASATNALINVYSRAISPSGVPTVSDKDHAREIIDRAYSKGQYAAVVDLMQQEMAAARKSPGQVREAMRGEMTGKEPPAGGGNETQAAAQKAWGSYEPDKYEYRMGPNGIQRRKK